MTSCTLRSLFLLGALLLLPRAAHAYVDPGLGGQVFQAAYLIAIGVLSVVVAPILLFARRIRKTVWRMRGVRRNVDTAPPDPPRDIVSP